MFLYLRKRKCKKALKQSGNCFRICCALLLASFLIAFSLVGCTSFFHGAKELETSFTGHEKDPGQHSNVPQEAANTEEQAKAKKESGQLHVVIVEEDSFLLIRKNPGAKDKPDNDIIARVPGGWHLEVINKHENKKVLDDNIWWEVKDPLLGITGWVAENFLRADTISLDTLYQTPFSNSEIFAAGARLGMSEQEVIEALGEPINKRTEHFEESGESYLIMEYPFGKFTLTDAYDDDYYWLCSIEINSKGVTGPRNIQVGEPCHSVLKKFPNKNAVGEYSNETMEVLYGEHLHGANNGIAFYDNQKLSEIMFATDEFIGLRITVENGVVTHFILFVQVS